MVNAPPNAPPFVTVRRAAFLGHVALFLPVAWLAFSGNGAVVAAAALGAGLLAAWTIRAKRGRIEKGWNGAALLGALLVTWFDWNWSDNLGFVWLIGAGIGLAISSVAVRYRRVAWVVLDALAPLFLLFGPLKPVATVLLPVAAVVALSYALSAVLATPLAVLGLMLPDDIETRALGPAVEEDRVVILKRTAIWLLVFGTLIGIPWGDVPVVVRALPVTVGLMLLGVAAHLARKRRLWLSSVARGEVPRWSIRRARAEDRKLETLFWGNRDFSRHVIEVELAEATYRSIGECRAALVQLDDRPAAQEGREPSESARDLHRVHGSPRVEVGS